MIADMLSRSPWGFALLFSLRFGIGFGFGRGGIGRGGDAEQLLDKHRKLRRFPAERERMAPCEPAPKEMESPDVPSTPAS